MKIADDDDDDSGGIGLCDDDRTLQGVPEVLINFLETSGERQMHFPQRRCMLYGREILLTGLQCGPTGGETAHVSAKVELLSGLV